jgi:hypothetical protein
MHFHNPFLMMQINVIATTDHLSSEFRYDLVAGAVKPIKGMLKS